MVYFTATVTPESGADIPLTASFELRKNGTAVPGSTILVALDTTQTIQTLSLTVPLTADAGDELTVVALNGNSIVDNTVLTVQKIGVTTA
jgi:hypothetical protein